MIKVFYAMTLLVISFTPPFSGKRELENSLKEKISHSESIEQTSPRFNVLTKKEAYKPEVFFSKNALVTDYESGAIIYEKNADDKTQIASITKLMTALIVVENLNPEKKVTVGKVEVRPLDSIMGLTEGDTLSVRGLLEGLLIESGSDAAKVLALATAGTENKFVALMNERASRLELKNTQFSNVVGYDDKNNYSTAREITKLTKIVLLNKTVSEIVSMKSSVVRADSGKIFELNNTNKLLYTEGYKGVKTGTTLIAGECLVTLYQEGERRIISVLLNSPSRFNEAESIIRWTKANFSW